MTNLENLEELEEFKLKEKYLKILSENQETFNPVVVWESQITRAEEKEFKEELERLGLKYGDCMKRYYNYSEGKYYNQWEFENTLHDNIVIFNKKQSTYSYSARLSVTGTDEGIIIRKIEFLPTRPIKKDYGIKDSVDILAEIFVDKNKRVFFNYYPGSYNNPDNFFENQLFAENIEICEANGDVASVDNLPWEKVYEKEISKIFGKRIYTLSSTMPCDISLSSYTFSQFLMYKEVKLKSGPKQRKVDTFSEYELRDLSYYDNSFKHGKILVLERIEAEEPLCAMRLLNIDYGKKAFELARIYVTKDSLYPCKENVHGDLVYMNATKDSHAWRGDLLVPNKDVFDGTMLQYFKISGEEGEIIDRAANTIYALLKHPILDQLTKVGYVAQFKNCSLFNRDKSDEEESYFYYSTPEPINQVNNRFGTIDNNKTGLYGKLGINKYQFERMLKDQDDIHASDVIPKIKRVLSYKHDGSSLRSLDIYSPYYVSSGKNLGFVSISDVDNKTFNRLYDFFRNYNQVNYEYNRKKIPYPDRVYHLSIDNIASILIAIRVAFSHQTMMSVLDSMEENFLSEISYETNIFGRVNQEKKALMQFYLDYIKMIIEMPEMEFPIKIESSQSVKELHDTAARIHTMKQDEIDEKNFRKAAAELKKLEFVSEDLGYSIVSPKKPSEIVQEGRALSHCVGSYAKSVTDGRTKIVFLRRNTSLDKPFFTIEVTPDNIVRQVHGAGNSSIRNAPEEAGEFLQRWIREMKLKVSGSVDRALIPLN